MNKRVIMVCALGLTMMFGTGFAFDFFGSSSINLPLKDVRFSRGGDMQGSFHAMSVKLEDNNSALVCYEDASWHHEVIAVKEYVVPAALLEDIKTIFNENKLARCEKASKSPFQVLDGATSSYSFYFEKKNIRFSSTQNLSKANYDALRAIKKCVADACAKGKRLPGLVLEKDKEGNMPVRNAIVEGQVAVKVVGYKAKGLDILIGNGLDEDKTVALQSKLTEISKPEAVVAEKITDKTITAYKSGNEDYRWELNKRLEAGKYRLDLGGYTTEFEIK